MLKQNLNAKFNLLFEWLESEAEVHLLAELKEKMEELSDSTEIYSIKCIKAKLIKQYTDHIFSTEVDGKSDVACFKDVVCFKDFASYLLNNTWYHKRKESIEDESSRVINTATKLILNDIRSKKFSCHSYPTDYDVSGLENGVQWLPKSLHNLQSKVIKDRTKVVSIDQAITQVSRPKSCISPVLFSVGVQIDHGFWI